MTQEQSEPVVLHIVFSLARGGTEGQCARIALACAGRGMRHHVAVSVREGAFLEAVEAACGPVHEMGVGGMFSPRSSRRVKGLQRYIRDHGIDLVHAWDADAVIFGSRAARAEGIPLLTSQRDLGRIYPWWKWRLLRREHRQATALVTNAAAIRAVLLAEGVPADSIHLLPNAVDLSEFGEAAAAEHIQVVMVSRLDREKDVGCFVRAATLLQTECPDIEWLVVGDGPERSHLEALAAGANLCFLGQRVDVPELLRGAAVGVLTPCANEGLSNAILEYFAAGLPVVATDCGGNAELVADGMNGYVIPVRDAEALAARVGELAASPERRKAFGVAGRQRVEDRHTLPSVVDQFLKLYRIL
jgi:glycosyltransferase involved in cell wall biosynthesis